MDYKKIISDYYGDAVIHSIESIGDNEYSVKGDDINDIVLIQDGKVIVAPID